MAMVDTVLEEVDRLLEEDGMVSSPLPTVVEEHVEIQSERGEHLDTPSFSSKAELFLIELLAIEHSTRELMQ